MLVFSSLGWNGVVRAEWGATLREVGDESIAVAHALDTAQSWSLVDLTVTLTLTLALTLTLTLALALTLTLALTQP